MSTVTPERKGHSTYTERMKINIHLQTSKYANGFESRWGWFDGGKGSMGERGKINKK
jgi:hypothetical protein